MSIFEPIPPVLDDYSIPEGAKCQEASSLSVKQYIPCYAPATSVVRHDKDDRSYYMCTPCAWHNVQNRGGQLMFSQPDKEQQSAIKHAIEGLESDVSTHVKTTIRPKPFTPKPESKPRRAKGGKYSAFVNDLPRFPGDDPDRRQVVEAVKQSILEPGEESLLPFDPNGLLDRMDTFAKAIYRGELRATAGRPWASEFARLYAELRMIRERIATWDASIGLLLEAYLALMVEQFEVEGISSLKLSNGQPVSTFLEPYVQVVNKEECRQWAVAQGLEHQMTLPWNTLNKLAKDMLLAGESEPPGTVVYAKTKVRLGHE